MRTELWVLVFPYNVYIAYSFERSTSMYNIEQSLHNIQLCYLAIHTRYELMLMGDGRYIVWFGKIKFIMNYYIFKGFG